MNAKTVRMDLFGSFGVELAGRHVTAEAWGRRRRAAELVQVLALAPDHALPREQAMALLWPEGDAASAGRNLRKAAHHARRMVGIDDFVVLDGSTVRLWPGAEVTSDVGVFEAAAYAALACSDDGERSRMAQAAVSLYGGEPLPERRGVAWRDEWVGNLERLYRDVLIAARQWGRLLGVEPTSEVAHRGIIRDRLDAGDRAGAIRQFDTMRQVLREEFGVGPSPESVALYEQVLSSEGRESPTPGERARALLAWGTVHWERADLDEAERAASGARALAIDAGLGRELADASELRGLVAYAQGRWRQVFADDFITSIETTPELAPFIYDANLCMSEFALHEPHGLADLSDFGEQLLTAAHRSGSLQARAVGLLLRGEVSLLAGQDLDLAGDHLRRSRVLHQAAGATSGHALALARLAQVEARTGNLEVAQQRHEEAIVLASRSAVANHLLPLIFGGMLETSSGDDAVRIMERAEVALDDGGACEPCSMSLHLGAAGVHADRGALEEARRHLGEAERICGMWQGGPWHAAVAEVSARLRRAEGAANDEVRDLLHTAAGLYDDSGRHQDAARCRGTLASAV